MNQMKEFLFEIGTEEIPSGYIVPAVEALRETLAQRFGALNLPHGGIKTFSTPRRLAALVGGLPETQPKSVARAYGPPAKAAFAADGSPTKAAAGFAKGKGVDPSALRVGQTDRGEYVYVEIEQGGAGTAQLLAGLAPEIALNLPFPKSMRWGSSNLSFTRPIHWVLALFGGEVVNFDMGGIRAGNTTRGHRFLGAQAIEVSGGADYVAKLKENFVIADLAERKEAVLQGARDAARRNGATLLEDGDLAETVACLTEWPVALWGSFDERFLALPRELLIASMKNHQKMFSVLDGGGALTNGFVGVSNMKAEDDAVVVAGYRRVLRARLADARFFFDEDRKRTLESFAEKLAGVVYQKKLGAVGEKIDRFTRLTGWLCDALELDIKEDALRVARLCKADLETLMVYEFPELQGVMGREYARLAGEKEAVYNGIRDHYLPRWSGDDSPRTDTGAVVGIADRIDTLAGCFGVGLVPTGAADPFALRRHALAIAQIIFDKRYSLGLGALIDAALAQLGDKLESPANDVKQQLLEFIEARLKNYWTGRDIPHDVAEATLAAGFDDLAVTKLRVEAMAELKKRDFFEPLAITFKRAGNITRDHRAGAVDERLFQSDTERALHTAIGAITDEVNGLITDRKFLEALEKIASLRATVDRFFDEVMVMTEDAAVRENRLNLLCRLTALFGEIADFSRIVA